MSKPRVLLTMPHGGKVDMCSAGAFWQASSEKRCTVDRFEGAGSAGMNNHNRCWVEPLNRFVDKPTHLAMLHADVHAPPYWLDILLAEMERVDADVISVIIPLKGVEGLTSTGFDTPDDEWQPRRLTMVEAFDRPVTFTDPNLILNAGCWLAKIGPWHTKVWFEMTDKIVKEPDGVWRARFIPEDWNWSRRLRQAGAKTFATRAVPLCHERDEFTNQKAWGTWETDWAYEEYLKRRKAFGNPALVPA